MRIQPAHSLVVLSREDDRLSLTMPPAGLLSAPGFEGLLACVFTLLSLCGVLYFLRFMPPMALAAGLGVLIGGGATVFCLGLCLRTWSIVRSPEDVVHTNGGLWGRKIRRWHSADVSSFWIESAPPYHLLIIGFRNGRNDTVLVGRNEEELRWMATILSDIKGKQSREEAPPWVLEGRVTKPSESVQPDTVVLTKSEGSLDLEFLPELRLEWRRKRLLGLSGLLLLAILASAWGLRGRVPPIVPAAAAALVIAVSLLRPRIHLRTAAIHLGKDRLLVTRLFGFLKNDLPLVELEHVQTWRERGRSELQILLKGKPKLRLLQGRPHEELEWAARILRVATRGASEPEPSRLKVDPAAGFCQVCAERMERRVVFCAQCRTPHHEECWAYIGMCSTYGCREIRFTREDA